MTGSRHLALQLFVCTLALSTCQLAAPQMVTDPGDGKEGSSGRGHSEREWISFNDFITSVYQAADSNKQALVDSFLVWAAAETGIPYIEDSTAYFLYTSTSITSIELAGDINGWSPYGATFQHLSGTNLYYRFEAFEMDARLDYKFVLDGSNWILDPRNPYTCAGGFGPNSELAMAAYIQPLEIQSFSDIPHGTLGSFNFSDSTQGRTRNVNVYLPPAYAESTDSFRTAYFHDGSEYVSLGYARNILDYLISQEQIPPIIGVFVNPTNRNSEYNYDYDFMAMFVNELVPYIDASYRTLTQPLDRAIIGVSLGGLTSLLFTIEHPEVFANCGAYSPAMGGEYGAVVQQYHESETLDTRIYIDAGTYEPSIWLPSMDLFDYLVMHGWTAQGFSWHEGHSWGAWRAHLDESLIFFWPLVATGIED